MVMKEMKKDEVNCKVGPDYLPINLTGYLAIGPDIQLLDRIFTARQN